MRQFVILSTLLLTSIYSLAQGVNGGRGTIYLNDASTGTTANLLAIGSGVNNTAINAGTATTGILGVCLTGCGTTGQSVVGDLGDIPCSFTGTATAGDFVQSAGSGSQCLDSGGTYPTSGGEVLGVVKTGGTGAGVYLVHWKANPNGTSGGGGSAFSGGSGSSYQDVVESAAPSNPASGTERCYTDSTSHKYTCINSSGTSVLLASSMPAPGLTSGAIATGITHKELAWVDFPVAVCQVAGTSFGASYASVNPPATITAANCPAGSATVTQFGTATFTAGTTRFDYKFKMPTDAVANGISSMVVDFVNNSDTTAGHTVIWDAQLVCTAATGVALPPTLGSVQNFTTAHPQGTALFSNVATLSSVTNTSAAGNICWISLSLDSSSTTAANDASPVNFRMYYIRNQAVQ